MARALLVGQLLPSSILCSLLFWVGVLRFSISFLDLRRDEDDTADDLDDDDARQALVLSFLLLFDFLFTFFFKSFLFHTESFRKRIIIITN